MIKALCFDFIIFKGDHVNESRRILVKKEFIVHLKSATFSDNFGIATHISSPNISKLLLQEIRDSLLAMNPYIISDAATTICVFLVHFSIALCST